MTSEPLTRRALLKTAGVAGGLATAGFLLEADAAAASGAEVQINVAEYGTLGTSDDSAAFQAALNAAGAAGGAQVVAPYGSYNVTNLAVSSGTQIWFPGVTLVNLAGATTPCLSIGGPATQVVVEAVRIDGSKAAGESSGLVIAGSYSRVTSAYVHDTKGHGIVVQGNPGPNPTTHITVDNCKVYGAGGNGITLASSGSESAPTHVLVDANHVESSRGAALAVAGVGMQVVFSNNFVENGLAAGEGGEGCAAYSHLNSGILCVGNSFYGVALQGIRLGGSHIAAVGNTITTPGRTGILIEADEPGTITTDFDVSANLIDGAGTPSAPFSGVYVEGMSGGAITANMIDNAAAHGVSANACSALAISGNTIKAPGLGSCVRINSCQRVTVVGNVAYNASQGYGVYVSAASPASADITIAGNVLSNNGAGGVAAVGESTRVAASGNTVHTAGAGSAVLLSGPANRTAANYTDTSTTVRAAQRLSVPRDVTFATVTGTTPISELDSATAEVGRALFLRFTEGATVMSGQNLVLASTFQAPVNGVLSLVCDGVTWYETARSVD